MKACCHFEETVLRGDAMQESTEKALRQFLLQDLRNQLDRSLTDDAMGLWARDVPREERKSAHTRMLEQEIRDFLAGPVTEEEKENHV